MKKPYNTIHMKIPTKAVYAYYFPEMRELVSSIANPYPHEVYLQSIAPGLDDFHTHAIDAYLEATKDFLPGLNQFPFQYTCAGASEGIFHILSYIKTYKSYAPLYVFDGEYEGYRGYAENIGMQFITVPFDSDIEKLAPGIFFISNPSARNGMVLEHDLIENIASAGHTIILDVSYVGLTRTDHVYVANHASIDAVLVSLSKPYGIYYHRIGFCFTKYNIKTLYVNKWFKNIFSHILAEKALQVFKLGTLAKKYETYQTKACKELSEHYGIPITPSDVILLGHIHENDVPVDKQQAIEQYKRGRYYRFGLTPFFLDYEHESN